MTKRSLFSPPDPFTVSPLVALLPSQGSLAKLTSFSASLYARLEKVQALQKEVVEGGGKRSSAEAAMLRQVLDWISAHGASDE